MKIHLCNIFVRMALISVMSDIPNDTDVICTLLRYGSNKSLGFSCKHVRVLRYDFKLPPGIY